VGDEGAAVRFRTLTIENFRAITRFHVEDLTDFILIAGPNGCGKSCVLDAIRLLKSVYGGYQPDEWMQWFGEFQINLNQREDLARLFRNSATPVRISGQIELAEIEKDYLNAQAEAILEPFVWKQVTGQRFDTSNFATAAIATQYREHGAAVETQLRRRSQDLRESLALPYYELALTINTDPRLEIQACPTMEAVFQTYDPEHLGVIDYHSALRTYQRETLGGINLDIHAAELQRRAQSLYNWQAKYQNVKSELATTYLRDLIAQQSGRAGENDLNVTLRELFQTFFPDKTYEGVIPERDGSLSFPVRLSTGERHDINELSSGEKEVLYGYLRLRSSTPRHSVILLDEPELHLNPGLLQGFPDFYHRNLGRAARNQLWLVTHSDTLLRQAVGNSNYSVYHMTTATATEPGANQALPVLADDELERATIDLVGDLATYRPQSKVVIFEGGGDTEFDVLMVQRLFPDFAKRVNLLSGGPKRRVRDLYEVLAQTASRVGMADRFFAILDRDSEPEARPAAGAHILMWNAYHIENYLLRPRYVRAAAEALMGRDPFTSEEPVLEALRECAQHIVNRLVVERLQKEVNAQIVSAVRISAPHDSERPARALLPSISGSYERIDALRNILLAEDHLQQRADEYSAHLRESLTGDAWLRDFPARLILRRFVGTRLKGAANYEAFRSLIVDQMADDRFEPEGMREVVSEILAAGN
jgi:energy-coupling factor transporter ATP-binding protein EcfA2